MHQAQNQQIVRGEKVLPNGVVYNGDLRNGRPDGEGTFKFPDGSTYQGGFKNGLIHGKGKITGGE